jgi:hypothetical protein
MQNTFRFNSEIEIRVAVGQQFLPQKATHTLRTSSWGEPTEKFLASMNAYDAAIAIRYNNPITNFSLHHYKFPQVAAAAM